MSPSYKKIKRAFVTPLLVRERRADKKVQRTLRINTLLLLTVFFLGVFYLGQINALATKGYEIKAFEKNISQLGKENKKLEYEIARQSSLGELKGRIDTLGLVRSERIDYISSDHSVAVAR